MKRAVGLFIAVILFTLPALARAEELAPVDGLAGISAIYALYDAWKDGSGSVVYPEDYAGAYLADGGQNAVVLIANLTAAREAELRALVPGAEIAFVSAKYTYRELMDAFDDIAADMDNAPLTVPGALGIGLDEVNNAVSITVNTADEAAARAYYTEKYGDKVRLETTRATEYLPMTDGVQPPQTGGAPGLFLPACLLALGALCFARAAARPPRGARRG